MTMTTLSVYMEQRGPIVYSSVLVPFVGIFFMVLVSENSFAAAFSLTSFQASLLLGIF